MLGIASDPLGSCDEVDYRVYRFFPFFFRRKVQRKHLWFYSLHLGKKRRGSRVCFSGNHAYFVLQKKDFCVLFPETETKTWKNLLKLHFYYGLYTKFEKSKTKNADPLIFLSDFFRNASTWLCGEGDILLHGTSSPLSFFPLDDAFWNDRYDTDSPRSIFSLYLRDWLRHSSCGCPDGIFPFLSCQKRNSSCLYSVSPFRCSGDRISRCYDHHCHTSLHCHISRLCRYSSQYSDSGILTQDRAFELGTSSFGSILLFSERESSSRDDELPCEKSGFCPFLIRRYPLAESKWKKR